LGGLRTHRPGARGDHSECRPGVHFTKEGGRQSGILPPMGPKEKSLRLEDLAERLKLRPRVEARQVLAKASAPDGKRG